MHLKMSFANCHPSCLGLSVLTHWGRVMHICVSKLNIIGSDNGLSPDRRQAIIWTNAGLLLIGPLGTNFSEIFIEILTFSFKKIHLKVSSAKRRPFCLGLNVIDVAAGGFPPAPDQWYLAANLQGQGPQQAFHPTPVIIQPTTFMIINNHNHVRFGKLTLNIWMRNEHVIYILITVILT